jgi:predicted dehydrogenase
MVAFNRRFNPWVGRAREAITSTGGGPPAVIIAEYHKAPQQYEHYPREVNERWIGVDAIHALDLLKHLGGDVQAIRAGSGRHLHGDVPDSFSGVLAFAGGTIGHLVSTYTSVPKIERLQLFGDRCWAVAEGIGSGMAGARMYRDGTYHDLALAPEDAKGTDVLGYWAEDRHFVRSILEGRPLSPPACDLDDAVTTMALVDAFLTGAS